MLEATPTRMRRWGGMRHVLLTLGVISWSATVAFGFGLLLGYKSIPSDFGAPLNHWPQKCDLTLSTNRKTLLLFSHPHCPCTRATLRELERIVASAPEKIEVYIIFAGLHGVAGNAAHTSLSSAAETNGLAKILYDDGHLAKQFQVRTSGHILLYDQQGLLCFTGGITPSRGHEGESAGGVALIDAVHKLTSNNAASAIFGCPLFGTTEDCDVRGCQGP